VSFREPMRMLLLLRQAGAGWVLILAVLEMIQLATLGGLRDRGRFVFSPNAMLLAVMGPMVMTMWMTVGQYQARWALSANELRVPRVLRTLCFTLSGLAAWTVFELLAPIVALHGPYLQWLLFIFYGICAGILVALFRGTYFELPILLSYGAVEFDASMGSSIVSPKWVELLAITLPLLIAWRLRVLIRALRTDAHGDLFLRSLVATEGWNLPARWSVGSRATASSGARQVLTAWRRAVFGENRDSRQRTVDRSSTGVWRVSLGPLYERRVSLILLCFAPLPIMLSLATHAYTIASTKSLTIPVLVSLPFLCGIFGVMFFLNRVRRLADLLYSPSGEIADLALLPGLGGRWLLQRRALLREVLVRPLSYYGLCLGGLVGSCWVLLRLGQAQIEPILFLVVPPSAMLLLFAMLTVGVLSGRLGRDSAWFNGSMYFLLPPMLLSMFASLGPRPPHEWTASLSTWLSIVWLIVLGAMAACLVRWGIQLSRRPNLLCP
jgi:hypothetical protein